MRGVRTVKKTISFLCLVMLFLQSTSIAAEKPDYEKYGRIAIAVVQADYPQDEVTDYEYKGRKQLENDEVEDRFSFLVKEKEKEFNITVKIKHNTKNQKLLHLEVEEI
jgi:Protein of unknown function (DUF3889)